MEIQGFLKSTSVILAASLIPAVASSPSISFATISTPVEPIGGRTPATAPSKTTFSILLYFWNFFGIFAVDIGGVIFFGGTPARRQPSARALTNSPTSSGESNPATTPVERTTKLRSVLISRLASSRDSSRLLRTSSAMDCRVSSTPVSVLPKTTSPGFGPRTSLVIFTTLLIICVLPVSILVAVRIHFVVVFPTSTEATMKKGFDFRSSKRTWGDSAILGFRAIFIPS